MTAASTRRMDRRSGASNTGARAGRGNRRHQEFTGARGRWTRSSRGASATRWGRPIPVAQPAMSFMPRWTRSRPPSGRRRGTPSFGGRDRTLRVCLCSGSARPQREQTRSPLYGALRTAPRVVVGLRHSREVLVRRFAGEHMGPRRFVRLDHGRRRIEEETTIWCSTRWRNAPGRGGINT